MVTDIKEVPMLTVREVAELLHVHANTLRRWSDMGVIRAYRITHRGDRRFKQEDINHFLVEFNAYRGMSHGNRNQPAKKNVKAALVKSA